MSSVLSQQTPSNSNVEDRVSQQDALDCLDVDDWAERIASASEVVMAQALNLPTVLPVTAQRLTKALRRDLASGGQEDELVVQNRILACTFASACPSSGFLCDLVIVRSGHLFGLMYQTHQAGFHPVVQHSRFDEHALNAACKAHNLPLPQMSWHNSVTIARTAWPELKGNGGHGLANLKNVLDLDFYRHDAGEDARAAAMVVLRAQVKLSGAKGALRFNPVQLLLPF